MDDLPKEPRFHMSNYKPVPPEVEKLAQELEQVVRDTTPWWRDFGDHRNDPHLVLLKEAEQVAILSQVALNQVHVCVQYKGWRSCKFMTSEEYSHLSLAQEMQLVSSEIDDLRRIWE